MNNVIAKLSNTVSSHDLLSKIDISEVYERFHSILVRLDDFKKARDEHEQRSFFGRLFNGDKLENAQLDAQEVQAEFSKVLAQLMVISSLQAQQLTGQQEQLAEQQKKIDAKADEIARQNSCLEQHQEEIKIQAADLRQYVSDLLQVQGLTEEHGEMLISIAKDVMETRDRLLADFDNRMQHVQEVLGEYQEQFSRGLDEQANMLEQRLTDLQQRFINSQEEGFKAVEQMTFVALKECRLDATSQVKQLETECASKMNKHDKNHSALSNQILELRELVAAQNQALLDERRERQQELTKRQSELDVLRNNQIDGEALIRREQRRLLAGLCGLAILFAGALGGLTFLNISKPTWAPVEIHK